MFKERVRCCHKTPEAGTRNGWMFDVDGVTLALKNKKKSQSRLNNKHNVMAALAKKLELVSGFPPF